MVKPIVAWVWAPHQSRDTGGTTAAASSFLTSRLPTCGPLPWVMTTSWPAAMRPATDSMAAAIAARWASGVALPSAAVIALPPRARRTRTDVPRFVDVADREPVRPVHREPTENRLP